MNKTVVALFIQNKKLLMNRRSKSRNVYAGFLMCPSGHSEENESLFETVIREMKEELNITVTKASHLFTLEDVDTVSRIPFSHNFMLIESFDGEITNSNEADELKWMTYAEMKNTELIPIVHKVIDELHRQQRI